MNTFQVGDQVVVTREHANFNIGDVVTITKVWAGSLHCTKDGGPECSVAITKVQAVPSIVKIEALLEAVQTILNRSAYTPALDTIVVGSEYMKNLHLAYERIVPPKTTEQLLQERLDAADAMLNFICGKYAKGQIQTVETYKQAKKAHEGSEK